MLTALALALTALLAGATGSWSPCGFSMVETIGGGARAGDRRSTGLAAATFALGALAGGVLTFGGLAIIGALLSGWAQAAGAAAAALIAIAAAAGEWRGLRIVPQIRRQVPEGWRRTLPLPLATGLYGVLLGLGFTTFVLSFAVWALAGISVALADPALGAVIGAAFGLGRALPVVALVRREGEEQTSAPLDAMAGDPRLLLGLRRLDATALVLCALTLGGGVAHARPISGATDPVATGFDLAWQAGGAGWLRRGGAEAVPLPGGDPAIGGPLIAWHDGAEVTVAERATLKPILRLTIRGVQELAVSERWLVFREPRRVDGGDVMRAFALDGSAHAVTVKSVPPRAELSRPAIFEDTVVFAAAGRSSRILAFNAATGAMRTLRQAVGELLLNPATDGTKLLYVRVTRCVQELRLGRLDDPTGAGDTVLLRSAAAVNRDHGYQPGYVHAYNHASLCPPGVQTPARRIIWTTALSARRAYFTTLHRDASGTLAPAVSSLPRAAG